MVTSGLVDDLSRIAPELHLREMSELSAAELSSLPGYWAKALQLSGRNRVEVVLGQWSISAWRIMSDTYGSLSEFLQDVHLAEYGGNLFCSMC
ncbi:hypothetical protein ACFXHA_21835 [Nocardia sp. NPDC059240]|uniref:hypothetical protein n=1 Tax=Nocardia sp. NPDC059240 TaxID=3346786 RepID=UPI0036CDCCFD